MLLLFHLYRGLICFRKTRVICGLVHMRLYIKVSIGSTRVEILGGRKTRWGRGSYWGEGKGGYHRQ